MVVECARFAASAATWVADRDRFEIRNVVGLDEYHWHVDNNAFTNVLASWSLRFAARACSALRSSDPGGWEELCRSTAVNDAEAASWITVADAMFVPRFCANGVIEQHDGYFDLAECPLRHPQRVRLTRFDTRERSDAIALCNFETKLIKQADVVLLLALFGDYGTSEQRAANYRYYEPRTTHESCLSYGPHGLLAIEAGFAADAYRFFIEAARYDLDYEPRSFHSNGVHLGAADSAWQIAVFGFAGVSASGDALRVAPHLPEGWHRLRFQISFRKRRIALSIERERVELTLLHGRPLVVHVADHRVELTGAGCKTVPTRPLAPNPHLSPRGLPDASRYGS